MLRRAVIFAGTPVLVGRVHAGEKDPSDRKQRIRPKDLPIYEHPAGARLEYVPEKVTAFRENISVFRKAICDFVNSLEVVKRYGSASLHYVQEDATVVPKAAIITVSGLGGLVAGYRAGVIKRASLAGALMVTAAAICYPHQAVDIAQNGWSQVKENVRSVTVSKILDSAGSKTTGEEKTTEVEVTETKSEKDTKLTAPTTSTKVDKSQKDFGQSKAEDKDMYTTRGR